MSVEGRIIIADLTREVARVGLAALDDPTVEVSADFGLPQRVAIRQEEAGLITLAGEEEASVRSDARTLVFNRLHKLLPRVGDAELRSRLIGALWRALCEELEKSGLVRPEGNCVGYVIPHHLSTQPLLEEFRAVCAGASVQPVGFVHEAAALILGFVRSPLFPKVFPTGGERATICLVVAYDEMGVDVACFDYSDARPPRRELVIRDFFHSTCVGLKKALEGRAWSGAVTHLISVEDEEVAGGALAALVAVLQGDDGAAAKKRFQTPGAHRLKIKGAAYVAQCCHGRGDPAAEFSISSAYNVGVQIDLKRFHPIMDGQQASMVYDFPRRAAQTFALQGQPGGELRLNLCCGYSERMAEAIPLGVMGVATGELARGAGRGAAVTVAVTLDAPGGGQFMLETPETGRPLGSQSFVLPSLVF